MRTLCERCANAARHGNTHSGKESGKRRDSESDEKNLPLRGGAMPAGEIDIEGRRSQGSMTQDSRESDDILAGITSLHCPVLGRELHCNYAINLPL